VISTSTSTSTRRCKRKNPSLTPADFLLTEPIVTALSAWIGFAWACIFLGGTSVILVFEQYGFNAGELGSMQA
jgi:hypothetical protein